MSKQTNKKTMTETENQWIDPALLGVNERAFFKPEDGKTFRLHLMSIPARAHVQFVAGLGFIHTLSRYSTKNGVMICEEAGLDVELLGREPMLMWMCPVLVYSTDKKGSIGTTKPENVEYEFKLWSFYSNDYRKLFNLAAEYGDEFSNKDILITGRKSGKYVNTEIVVAARDAICLLPPIKAKVEAQFSAYKFRDASQHIARTVTEAELRDAVDAIEATAGHATGKVKNESND